jgi:hypothetical protein
MSCSFARWHPPEQTSPKQKPTCTRLVRPSEVGFLACTVSGGPSLRLVPKSRLYSSPILSIAGTNFHTRTHTRTARCAPIANPPHVLALLLRRDHHFQTTRMGTGTCTQQRASWHAPCLSHGAAPAFPSLYLSPQGLHDNNKSAFVCSLWLHFCRSVE